MSSETYRFYCLDCSGQLHNAEWLSAESDEDAVIKIAAAHADAKCEIWQGTRLVAKLFPKRRSA